MAKHFDQDRKRGQPLKIFILSSFTVMQNLVAVCHTV